jgi:hypothetical protein
MSRRPCDEKGCSKGDELTPWLHRLGLIRYARALREARIDHLAAATETRLVALRVPIGPRRKLQHAAATSQVLRPRTTTTSVWSLALAAAPPASPQHTWLQVRHLPHLLTPCTTHYQVAAGHATLQSVPRATRPPRSVGGISVSLCQVNN